MASLQITAVVDRQCSLPTLPNSKLTNNTVARFTVHYSNNVIVSQLTEEILYLILNL